MKRVFILLLLASTISCKEEGKNNLDNTYAYTKNPSYPLINKNKKDHQLREVKKAEITPSIDGKMNDPIWHDLPWYPMDQNWIGAYPDFQDFLGRYKITWTPEALYIIAEIKDDILLDQYENPLQRWWDDDCITLFIDADNSGGKYQYSNNAFAYHIALDGTVIDLDANKNPILYNHHITSKRITDNNVSVWEFKLTIFNKTYKEGRPNEPLILKEHQKLGFAIAYNDNDTSIQRENLMGSVFIAGEDKNPGWLHADVFGTILLIE